MQRALSSFPFTPQQRVRLQGAGFTTAEDILELRPSELSKELQISKEEALELFEVVRVDTERINSGVSTSSNSCNDMKVVPQNPRVTNQSSVSKSTNRTALEMLKDEKMRLSIITFSSQIDNMLGGGVPLTKITEVCGAPGVGKTQLAIQLTVDVQIPKCFGGVGGESVYIDTEGSFIVDRVADIAQATITHCQHICNIENNSELTEVMKTFNLESVLSKIHYYRCHDYVELLALLHTLPEFLQQNKNISLIVLDSVAFPFRHDFDDYSLRTRLLNGLAQSFIKMATEFQLAVFLTNQMTTKISTNRSQPSHLIPALGESWGHASTVRIILYWRQNQRCALLYKSPSQKETTVTYQITTGGIRDVNVVHQEDPQDLAAASDESQPKKRARTD